MYNGYINTMTYFLILSPDLKSELLQHFSIEVIDKLCSQLTAFHYFLHDNNFWKQVYVTHISDNSSYRNLCLKSSNSVYHNTINYIDTIICNCLYEDAKKLLPYVIDKTNKLFNREVDTNVSYSTMRHLIRTKDIKTIKYLYENGHLNVNDFVSEMFFYPTLFKYFIPAIIQTDISKLIDLLKCNYIYSSAYRNSSLHPVFNEVLTYLESLLPVQK